MKVFIFCMAFAAVTLAMPVAEEKSVAPVVAEPVPVSKTDEVQPQVKADASVVEEKKPEETVENKEAEKPQEPEAKSVAVEPKPEEAKQPEAPVAINALDVKNEDPEPKSAAPVNAESDVKPVEKPSDEAKPEEKIEEPQVKPVVIEEVKPETEAKVEEVKEEISVPSPKSALPEEAIDVVAAVKNPASVADEVVAISSPEKPELPILATKSAEPVSDEKKEDTPVPAPKTSLTEESKPVEAKTEEKPENVEVPAPAPVIKAAPAEVKADDVSAAPVDDPLRVVRDTVEDKQAMASSPVSEAKSAEPSAAVEAPKEIEVEKKQDSKPIEAVVASEPAKETPVAEVIGDAAPKTSVAERKAAKDEEKPAGDAPADSSEESAESSEKKGDSAESSEEVTDKKGNEGSKS